MEILNLILNTENVRTLFLALIVLGCAIWLRMDLLNKLVSKEELDEKLDKGFSAFHKQLKENDFHHIHQAIKALTFVLCKEDMLKEEDRQYVEKQLEEN